MNLPDLLAERSHLADDLGATGRFAAVRARVRARRRRRAVASAVCAVALVAGLAHAVAPDRTESAPAGPVTIEGFPEYQSGTRVVAAVSRPLSERTVVVPYTPTTVDMWVYTRCDQGGPTVYLRITVDGEVMTPRTTCGGGKSAPMRGLRPGVPAVVEVTAIAAVEFVGEDTRDVPLPTSGVLAVAVSEGVPVAEYPFPPRPAELTPLPYVHPEAVPLLSGHGVGRRERTLTWPTGSYMVDLRANTPGRLVVRVDGVEIGEHDFWDYTASGGARPVEDVRAGARVTVVVESERISGDWAVLLVPLG